jgi:hypothetical protein
VIFSRMRMSWEDQRFSVFEAAVLVTAVNLLLCV